MTAHLAKQGLPRSEEPERPLLCQRVGPQPPRHQPTPHHPLQLRTRRHPVRRFPHRSRTAGVPHYNGHGRPRRQRRRPKPRRRRTQTRRMVYHLNDRHPLRVHCAEQIQSRQQFFKYLLDEEEINRDLDHHRHPAPGLVTLYQQRRELRWRSWRSSPPFWARKSYGPCAPTGLVKEIYTLLITYQVLRTTMADATRDQGSSEPVLASSNEPSPHTTPGAPSTGPATKPPSASTSSPHQATLDTPRQRLTTRHCRSSGINRSVDGGIHRVRLQHWPRS